jgi:hypothetical protein
MRAAQQAGVDTMRSDARRLESRCCSGRVIEGVPLQVVGVLARRVTTGH